jgi:hypothetical protein
MKPDIPCPYSDAELELALFFRIHRTCEYMIHTVTHLTGHQLLDRELKESFLKVQMLMLDLQHQSFRNDATSIVSRCCLTGVRLL